MSKILVVGNPSLDQIDNVYFGAGGPVSYISNILSSYGHNVTMYSSFAEDFPIESLNPKIRLIKNISKKTTKFILSYENDLREFEIQSEATKLDLSKLSLRKQFCIVTKMKVFTKLKFIKEYQTRISKNIIFLFLKLI